MNKPILIAEDIPYDVELLRRELGKAGVANPIVEASDGDAVIAYFKGEREFSNRQEFPLPGILFLDLKMPPKGGFEVLEWLREQPDMEDLLVIVLSGHRGFGEIPHAYALGADSFMVKPCTQVNIQDVMRIFPKPWAHETLRAEEIAGQI